MPRPRKQRVVNNRPEVNFFKPQGVPLRTLKQVVLTEEGLESVRLADSLNLSHEQAAEKMNISRPTFSRLVAESRKIIADALINGLAIKIEGGNFTINDNNGGD